LARLRPEIQKLCVVRTFTDIEKLVGAATELERVLGEIGKTPFEPLKEEQDEGVEETLMEKQVIALCRAPKFLVDPLKGPSMRQCGRNWNLEHDPNFQH